jgi:hypothetical protein
MLLEVQQLVLLQLSSLKIAESRWLYGLADNYFERAG